MNIENDRVVSIHYTLTDDSGETLDSSQGGDPLNYLHGKGNIIPGLESALAGKEAGAELKVDVPPEQGYGPRQPELIQSVPREAFQGVEKIEPGMQFQTQTPEGNQQIVTVVGVEEASVQIDANHPLAGATLHFDVTVVNVREATAEELAHGHVHDGTTH